jgi:hypothetical protein
MNDIPYLPLVNAILSREVILRAIVVAVSVAPPDFPNRSACEFCRSLLFTADNALGMSMRPVAIPARQSFWS